MGQLVPSYDTLSIDEPIFKPLYCANNGCSNAFIRVLSAMMVLKESEGLSDAKLFEECRYNAIIQSALGLMRWGDPVPVESKKLNKDIHPKEV